MFASRNSIERILRRELLDANEDRIGCLSACLRATESGAGPEVLAYTATARDASRTHFIAAIFRLNDFLRSGVVPEGLVAKMAGREESRSAARRSGAATPN